MPGSAEAVDAGADDFVTKPFGMKELLARMRAVRRRAANEAELDPVLRFGELEVDLLKTLVTLAGEAIHLTPTEYRLLHFFAMAAVVGIVLVHVVMVVLVPKTFPSMITGKARRPA